MKLRTKFQDEDFELGEVVDANIFYSGDVREGFKVVAIAKAGGLHSFYYNSIKDFTDHWEDYEEPKEYIEYIGLKMEDYDRTTVEIQYQTKEEAEKAVEKLKAWKRLKDNGFKFEGWKRDERYCGDFTITATDQTSCDDKDLELLFGDEE